MAKGIATAPAPGKNMTRIPSGTFVMGDDAHYPEERPARRAEVDTFLIDDHPDS